jgi:YfiH family protein
VTKQASEQLESPSWRDERLDLCGFTLRGSAPVAATTCTTQEHARQVHLIDGPDSPPRGDALWTRSPGLPIAVRVADCVPVLLWDPEAEAVAAVHAGWRGTAMDIVGAAVRAAGPIGVRPERLKAAIGPSIGPCCFEVGSEVVGALVDCGLSEHQIGARLGPRGRPHVDLRAANRALLQRAGLADQNIEDVGGCSHCEPQRYESYRRDGARSGRMHGVISLARALAVGLGLLLGTGCDAQKPEPSPDALVAARADAAAAMIEEGEPQGAEVEVRDLLEERPDDAHLRALLARSLHGQQRYTEALVQGRLALGIDPQLWQAAYNLACSSAALGDLDQSIRWLQVALRSGVPSAREVASDPDLLSLQDDHRFSFYLATGILSRDEKDALALVQPSSVKVGEMATVTLTAIALNRPLMSPRERVEVRPASPFPPGFILPVSRRETFSTGEEGGREYSQRTFQYTFEVLRSGLLQLGPFEVRQGDSVHWTEPLLLRVQEGDGTALERSAQRALLAPGEFFASPSLVDERLRLQHEQRGGTVVALDPLAEQAIESPWRAHSGSESRYFQFRAAGIERLPGSLPPRQPQVFRSIFIQRGTEGFSHVAELRPSARLRESTESR